MNLFIHKKEYINVMYCCKWKIATFFPLLLTELYFLFMLKKKYLLNQTKGATSRCWSKQTLYILFIYRTHKTHVTLKQKYIVIWLHHDFPVFSHLCIRHTNLPTYIVVTLINLFFKLCINVRMSILSFVKTNLHV